MTFGGALQLSPELRLFKHYGRTKQYKSVDLRSQIHMLSFTLSSRASRQDAWNLHVAEGIYKPLSHVPHRCHVFTCQSFSMPSSVNEIPLLKSTSLVLTRSYHALRGSPLIIQLVPAIGIIAFALWCLGPLMRRSRNMFLHQNDSNWKKSTTYYILTSYLQPFLLWTGAILICRALDPIVLTTEASQVVKQRMLNFVRSLSTVLAFAYCLSSLIQQTQKFFMETSDSNDSRNMGFHFAGRAVYTAVWIAAVSLFMELLGFSTQKWLTAGGLGTVLLTLAGREIFTNFLSSIMIHATRPFVVNEWIQTKIEGYEVSGTVEHVGWWSPTIIRGEDREAVHIPNHKFTVNVVRNLSQKTHWRIKTHLAISHLDANKINNIVADMRKVLAKNPHVEQQRLHRRVFLDNINPENQALLILVSCFVKTSHFEEYLCVKEAIVLDLLRVISHHRARLATPIRTVQKIYGDADIENIPFADSVVSRAGVSSHRPLLLVEPPSRINGDDKAKVRPPQRGSEERSSKTTTPSEPKVATVSEGTIQNNLEKQQEKKAKSGDALTRTSNKVNPTTSPASNPPSKSQPLEGLGASGLGFKAGGEKPSSSEIGSEQADVNAPTIYTKREGEGSPISQTSTARPVLEENIVLGLALEGSKRTLPIEEEIPIPVTAETKEMATHRNGAGSPSSLNDKKEGHIPGNSGSTAVDHRIPER